MSAVIFKCHQIAQSIKAILATADFRAPLRTSLVPTRGTGAPTYTRATTATVIDYEGVLRQVLSGEARFTGARRVRNLLTFTEDLTNGAWFKSNLTSTTATTVTYAAAKPSQLYQNALGGSVATASAIGTTYIAQIKVNGTVGNKINFYVMNGAASRGSAVQITLSETPTVYSLAYTVTNAEAIYVWLMPDNFLGLTVGTLSQTVTATQWQCEDITGRTDQTTPSEYVSVGAICMDGDDNYLSLPGTAGNYASTPDSVAASITGDIDIRVKAALADWTPAINAQLVSKRNDATGAPEAYAFLVNSSGTLGKLSFIHNNGGTQTVVTSSVGTGIADGAVGYARMTWAQSTGFVNFYTSTDGITWAQLGTANIAGPTTAMNDGTRTIQLGSNPVANNELMAGKIYQAQIYNGINGTLAVDFNANRDATTPTGTITSSTTGEVWTVNGASSLVRNNTYHGTGVDGVKCYDTTLAGVPIPTTTLKGYLAEGARTNLCLQSNAFSTTWTNGNLSTITQNSTGPDGSSTSAWTLTDSVGGVNSFISQSITLVSGSTYTLSIFVKKTSGAQSSYPMLLANDSVTGAAICTVDTSNGVATIWTALTGFALVSSSASCQSFNSTFWRVSLTFTSNSNNAWTFVLYPAGTSDASQSSGTGVTQSVTGSTVFYGAQLEVGPAATSYIPTTTVAVTRNADVLTYPSAGNLVTLADYSIYCESIIGSAGLTSGPLIASTDLYRPFLSIRTEANKLDAYSNTSGTGPAAVAVLDTDKTSRICKYGMSKNSTTINAVANAVIASTAIGTQGAEISTICIGRAGGNILDGNIANVCIWQRQVPNAILARITK